jgi:hypothetical protein
MVQKQDSKSPNIFWWTILTVLEGELGSPSFRELVALCFSFPMRPISLETEFYNSRYSYKFEERLESNSSMSRQWQFEI